MSLILNNGNKMKNYNMPLLLIFCVLFFTSNCTNAATVDYTGGLAELKNAITDTAQVRNFNQSSNIVIDANLPTLNASGANFTINGNDYSIDGNSMSGLTTSPGQIVNISNVGSLDNTGAVVTSIKNFYRTTSGGGLIYASGSEVNISNSVFSNNKVEYTNTGTGGVLWSYNWGTKNTITGSTFNNNSAKWGGAIANYNCGGISTIDNSTFSGNYAASQGGAIYSNAYGGSILTQISNSRFINNSSGYAGGAILNKLGINQSASTVILTIDNSVFTGNHASTNMGGAIYSFSGTAIVKNSTFTGNYAKESGAICNAAGSFIISNSVFTDNYAIDSYAGAISSKSGSTTSIANSSFINNIAAKEGGAMFTNNTSLDISNSLFTGNNSTSADGGAIYTAGGTSTTDNSTFMVNHSDNGSGGAIYNEGGTSTINNSTFMSNYSDKGSGGAIYNEGGTSTINNSTFMSNYSDKGSGGAIYNEGGTSTINNSTFMSNYSDKGYGGAIYNDGGTLFITNSTFNGNYSSKTRGGAIYNAGTLNILANNGSTTFSGNTASGQSEAIYLDSGVLNLNAGGVGQIVFNDKISSKNLGNVININKSGSVNPSDPQLGSPTNGKILFNQSVSNSTINLYNGTMSLARDNYLDGSSLNLYGGNIGMANNSIGTANLKNLSLTGITNLSIDADLANKKADMITSIGNVTGSGKLNINQINLLSDSKTRSTDVKIADASTRNFIQLSGTKIETPIYKYDMSYNSSTGSLGFTNTGCSPSVLAAPVGASGGAYLNQTSTYSEAVGRMDSLMSLTQQERIAMKYKNKYASADGNFVFSPTMLQEERAGAWFKQYTTFENVPMKNGPNVSNVGYGMLVGLDSQMRDLRHGYTGYLTAYTGYNGSHQNYDNVGVYQNGGLFGLTGTAYKGNFFTALTLCAGGSAGNNYNSYGTDSFTTMMAGAAIKSGYNFELLRGKMIIQPSYMMSYSFIKTFDYTAASGVDITSDPLNAIQISPGVKFIGNLKNGLQPYVGLSMVWNVMQSSNFYANDVQLPQLSVLPYVEYGVGVQRKWGSRFTGFGQAMARGGGRNGVAIQFGFRWAL